MIERQSERNVALTRLPGSFGAPLVGEVPEFSADPVEFIWERYRRYGPVFRSQLGVPIVFLMGPEANRLVLHDGGQYLSVAQAWPRFMRIMLGEEVYSMQDGQPMMRLKKLTSVAFRPDMLSAALDSTLDIAGSYLRTWAASGEVSAMFPEARSLVFKSMWAWLTGMRRMAEQLEELDRLYQTFMKVPEARISGGSAIMGDAAVRRRHVMEKLFAKARLEENLHDMLGERRRSGTDDVLSAWAVAENQENTRMADGQIVSHALMLIVAGGDATASSLTWLIQALHHYPEVLARLRVEIDAVVGSGRLQFQHFKQMPYLMCVLKELERYYSPAFGSIRKVIETLEFNGHKIPAGWNLRLCNFVSHRMPAVFTDPDRFDPDRFGPEREEDKRTPYSLVGFGAGQRQCSGKPFALMFLCAVAVRMVREYDWICSAEQDLTPVLYGQAIFIPRSNLVVRFRPRAPVSTKPDLNRRGWPCLTSRRSIQRDGYRQHRDGVRPQIRTRTMTRRAVPIRTGLCCRARGRRSYFIRLPV